MAYHIIRVETFEDLEWVGRGFAEFGGGGHALVRTIDVQPRSVHDTLKEAKSEIKYLKSRDRERKAKVAYYITDRSVYNRIKQVFHTEKEYKKANKKK